MAFDIKTARPVAGVSERADAKIRKFDPTSAKPAAASLKAIPSIKRTEGLFGTSIGQTSELLRMARKPEQIIRSDAQALMDIVEPETTSVPLNALIRIPQTLGAIGTEVAAQAVSPESVILAGAMRGVAPIIKPAIKLAGKGIGELWGMVTGAAGAVTKAAQAGLKGGEAQKALIGTMRGTVSEKQVANDALDSLAEIRRKRGRKYVKQMESIYKTSFQKKIDLTPIKTELDDLLDSYNIARSKTGAMDFSRAALDDVSANDVKRIAKLVDEWGMKAGDNTVKGLDILKRRIDDFYSPSSEARAFVTSLRNKVKKTITDKVPKYKEVTKDYAEISDLIHDISSELSLGPKAKAGTIVRKLKQALRQNFDLRKEFVETLDKFGNLNLMEQIAGIELAPLLPKGLSRAVATGTLGASYLSPSVLATLPFYSPRLAGETALKFGQASRLAAKGAAPFIRRPVVSGIGLEAARKVFTGGAPSPETPGYINIRKLLKQEDEKAE